MDPLGIVALVVGAGWLVGKLTEGRKPPTSRDEQPWIQGRRFEPDKLHARARPNRPPVRRTAEDDPIEVLPEYELVRDLVRHQFPITFVTGGAGTGKSTFVKWLTNEFSGQVLIGAPTGIAALNVGGKTLHSLCQFPPAWITRNDIKEVRRSLAKAAKLLIIDEISMVNANLLDGVSNFFQVNRESTQPFGGLPVVMVGDLFQLPPVITRDMAELFKQEGYTSKKFFGAHTLRKAPYYAVELKKAFRQVDQDFVNLLARVREGIDVDDCLVEINRQCATVKEPAEGAVWLSPRNAEADKRNIHKLEALPGPVRRYEGRLTGQFREDRLPAPRRIDLKVGAQVMLIKNSTKWVNGSLATVERLLDDVVHVRLYETGEVVEVGSAVWEQYDYRFQQATGDIERVVVGEYCQIPLILAWAMTIHKSQGKTIERVHIDLGAGAFETGQTYVALSRCRALSRMTLSRPLKAADVKVDAEAADFYQKLRAQIELVPIEAMRARLSGNQSTPRLD